MKPVTLTVQRNTPLDGWTNNILRVDLSTMTARVTETAPYVPDYFGGRGLAARIAWDEYPEPVEPFSPENPLMVIPGALTGTRSPYSGRTNVSAFSPQSEPYHWFTRANIGGRFGGELKRAGYDGLIVTGAAEGPVRLVIRDEQITVLPADEMWGLDTGQIAEALEAVEGKRARSLVIGPAGEHLGAIATIHTASSSATGNGGFGAVMGSKNLKAITVQGTGSVRVADPDRLAELVNLVGEEARSTRQMKQRIQAMNKSLAAEGAGRVRPYACTESCTSPCNVWYEDMPGRAYQRNYSGHWTCVGTLFRGFPEGGHHSFGGVFDWNLGTCGGFEMNMLSNLYGLNQWDIVVSMVPWLEACQNAGLVSKMNDMEMNWQSPEFWAEFLRVMAYREGMGDALAEGGLGASKKLNLGTDLARRYYTAWGHSGHWDGHGAWCNYIVYPFWLVSALQWLTDTRDPIPSGHGYVEGVMYRGPVDIRPGADSGITWDHMRAIAAKIYGDPDSLDPYSGYKAKAFPGYYHMQRSVIKDCLPTDDRVFPLIISPNQPDYYCRLDGLEGHQVEHELFVAGTGVDWTEAEFDAAADRVYNIERALNIRHWNRNRALDERVLPSFEYTENWQSALLEKRHALDRQQFKPVMDDYYKLLGWDPDTAWPTRQRLDELGMGEVYDPMVAGAQAAKERLPKLEPLGPVPQIND